jgi:hypothetical protein
MDITLISYEKSYDPTYDEVSQFQKLRQPPLWNGSPPRMNVRSFCYYSSRVFFTFVIFILGKGG